MRDWTAYKHCSSSASLLSTYFSTSFWFCWKWSSFSFHVVFWPVHIQIIVTSLWTIMDTIFLNRSLFTDLSWNCWMLVWAYHKCYMFKHYTCWQLSLVLIHTTTSQNKTLASHSLWIWFKLLTWSITKLGTNIPQLMHVQNTQPPHSFISTLQNKLQYTLDIHQLVP